MTLTATIRHSSIARARVIACGRSLRRAKTIASREFGDGFRDHVIVVANAAGEIVSERRVSSRKWSDR